MEAFAGPSGMMLPMVVAIDLRDPPHMLRARTRTISARPSAPHHREQRHTPWLGVWAAGLTGAFVAARSVPCRLLGRAPRGRLARKLARQAASTVVEEQRTSQAPDLVPGTWQEVAGCSVLCPPSWAGPPETVVHFLGGAFVGAAPRLFYRKLLERLAEDARCVVVITPYKLSFDYDEAATAAVELFDAALLELGGELSSLPVLGVGHSCGALLHALLAERRSLAGCVLMSFNNRPFSDAVPVEVPQLGDPQLRDLLRAGTEAALEDGRVEESLRVAGTAAEAAAGAILGYESATSETPDSKAREAAPVLSQLGPLLGSFVGGTREFTVSNEEVAARLMQGYAVPRTLLVEFANDITDETPRLLGMLERAAARQADLETPEAPAAAADSDVDAAGPAAAAETSEAAEAATLTPQPSAPGRLGVVERLRFPGGHTAPCDPPLGDENRITRLAAAIGRFARGQPAAENELELPDLKGQLFRLTAGTNRGLSIVPPRRRAEILACIEEMEALSVPPGGEVPEELFGNWRLVWATSPDVLLLAALPLVDCGEIRQDIPRQVVRPGEPIEVFNSVELSPSGFNLLAPVPQLARAATVKTVIRALAEPQEDGLLGIRFEGGTLEPGIPGLPPLPLPQLPSVQLTSGASGGSSVRLLTSFLDSELRFARSPVGDVFVLQRLD